MYKLKGVYKNITILSSKILALRKTLYLRCGIKVKPYTYVAGIMVKPYTYVAGIKVKPYTYVAGIWLNNVAKLRTLFMWNANICFYFSC